MGEPKNVKRPRLFDNERLDLVDALPIVDSAIDLFRSISLGLIDPTKRGFVMKGFSPVAAPSVLTEFQLKGNEVGVALNADGQILVRELAGVFGTTLANTAGTGWNVLYLYYNEAVSDQDARKRWDSTPPGTEESINEYTRITSAWEIFNQVVPLAAIPAPGGFLPQDMEDGRYDNNFLDVASIHGQTVSLIPLAFVWYDGGVPANYVMYDRRPMYGMVADQNPAYPQDLHIEDPYPASGNPFRTGAVASPGFGITSIRNMYKAISYAIRQYVFRDSAAAPANQDRKFKYWWDWTRTKTEADTLSGTPYLTSTPVTTFPAFPTNIRGLMEVDNDVLNACHDAMTDTWQTTLFNSRSAVKTATIITAPIGGIADYVGDQAPMNAINRLAALGVSGSIYVRRGVYSGGLVAQAAFPAGKTIVIQGEGASLSGSWIDIGAHPLVFDGCDVIIKDIMITCLGNANAVVQVHGGRLFMQNVRILQTGNKPAISVTGSPAYVRDCTMSAATRTVYGGAAALLHMHDTYVFASNGFAVDCPAKVIDNCEIHGAVWVKQAHSQITNNEIVAGSHVVGIYMDVVRDVMISHNYVSGFGSAGIYAEGSNVSSIEGLSVIDNEVTGCGFTGGGGSMPTGAIILCTRGGKMSRVAVRDNDVHDNVVTAPAPVYTADDYGQFGIFVGNVSFGAASEVERIVVSHNKVRNNGVSVLVVVPVPAGNHAAELDARRIFAQIAVSAGLMEIPPGTYESTCEVNDNQIESLDRIGYSILVTAKPWRLGGGGGALTDNAFGMISVHGNQIRNGSASAMPLIGFEVLGVPVAPDVLPATGEAYVAKKISIQGNVLWDFGDADKLWYAAASIATISSRLGVNDTYWKIQSVTVNGNIVEIANVRQYWLTVTTAGILRITSWNIVGNNAVKPGGPPPTHVSSGTIGGNFDEHNTEV